jgi:hypothetical protein
MKREAANGRSLTHFYHEQSQLVRVQRSVTKVITRTLDCQIAMLSHRCGERFGTPPGSYINLILLGAMVLGLVLSLSRKNAVQSAA